jgi:ankyrin repeat protein
MKTKMMNSIKEITTMLFISLLLTLVACSNEQSGTAQVNNKKNASESVTKPSMDIHAAAFMGNVKAIKEHVAVGTELNKKDQYGSTPLGIAATFGKTDAAKALINGGADLHAVNNDGSTPLHIAAFFCRVEIVKALLAKGADKSIKNKYGSTPYESVAGAYTDVEGIYKQIAKDLGH